MYVVYIATYFPILVLSVDMIINRVALSYKHLLTNIIVFLLYIFSAWIASLLQNRPTYANHLAFKETYGNHFTYVEKDSWTISTANNCLNNVFNWNPATGNGNFVVKDWSKNLWITLGTGFGTLIITHLVITFISQVKYQASKVENTTESTGVNDS